MISKRNLIFGSIAIASIIGTGVFADSFDPGTPAASPTPAPTTTAQVGNPTPAASATPAATATPDPTDNATPAPTATPEASVQPATPAPTPIVNPGGWTTTTPDPTGPIMVNQACTISPIDNLQHQYNTWLYPDGHSTTVDNGPNSRCIGIVG